MRAGHIVHTHDRARSPGGWGECVARRLAAIMGHVSTRAVRPRRPNTSPQVPCVPLGASPSTRLRTRELCLAVTYCVRQNNEVRPLRFTRGSRKHRVGRKSGYHVIAMVPADVTIDPETGATVLTWVGADERGENLEWSRSKGPTATW